MSINVSLSLKFISLWNCPIRFLRVSSYTFFHCSVFRISPNSTSVNLAFSLLTIDRRLSSKNFLNICSLFLYYNWWLPQPWLWTKTLTKTNFTSSSLDSKCWYNANQSTRGFTQRTDLKVSLELLYKKESYQELVKENQAILFHSYLCFESLFVITIICMMGRFKWHVVYLSVSDHSCVLYVAITASQSTDELQTST